MAEKSSFDHKAFKDFEHDGWEEVAGNYKDTFARVTGQAIGPILDAVGVGPGVRVLDVSCGNGVVAGAAAAREAEVVAVDISANMLAEARHQFPGPEYRIGDAENLPFGNGEFDAVVCNFGVLHFADPERALAEAFRVLRPGGRYAYTDWIAPEHNPYFNLLISSIREHGTLDVGLPEGPPMFRFSDSEFAARALSQAGFADPATVTVDIVSDWERDEQVLGLYAKGAVRMGSLLRGQSDGGREKIDQAVLEKAQGFKDGGRYRIPIPALLAHGRKP